MGQWELNDTKWYTMMTDMFLFSFVRDPIDRFLSAFYEVHTRDHIKERLWSKLKVEEYVGIERMRMLLKHFKENIDSKMNATQIKTNHLWKGEHHFHPQMLFLW